MANEEQLAILKQGVDVWNEWRKDHKTEIDLENANLKLAMLENVNLSNANLRKADLSGANLRKANLRDADLNSVDLVTANMAGADLRGTNLFKANLGEADLGRANLSEANLRKAILYRAKLLKTRLVKADLTESTLIGAYLNEADLHEAQLTGAECHEANFHRARLVGATLESANFTRADLGGADLSHADLRGAYLVGADLIETNLRDANLAEVNLSFVRIVGAQLQRANLSNCSVFGVSAWQVNLEGASQSDLIITDLGEPTITVDNLEIAQFIYLLIHNEKLRDVIDTIGKKAVLILGRFTDERKAVLEAIREELRKRDYIPILFDFEKPDSRDVTETVGLLAHMARFVIADLTDAKSIPQELSHIVPDLPSVAVQPLILSGQREYGMFEHFQRYPWVLPIHEYESQAQLIAELPDKVIEPAEAKVDELRPAK